MSVSLADLLPDAQWDPSSDVLLERFLRYTAGKRLALYPAQEEAILELLDGKNVFVPIKGAGGLSPARNTLEAKYAWAWAQNIWSDMLG